MLEELVVENLGVIEHAQLGFGAGMTVLTGETGAGKTMLIGALQMVLGARTDPRLIREGADSASVEARFSLQGEEYVLKRVVSAQGRSRGYINGRMATAGELAEFGAKAVDVHGQHAQMRLESPSAQLALLDRFVGVDLGPRRELGERLAEIERRIDRTRSGLAERERELAVVRFELGEIDRVAPTDANEDLTLEGELDLLEREEEYREIFLGLLGAISGAEGDGGAVADFSHLARRLQREAATAELAERLDSVVIELDEISREVLGRLESLTGDPERPDAIRSRLLVLRDLKKRFGPDLADVIATRENLSDRLGVLEGAGGSVEELEAEAASHKERISQADARIRALRQKGALKIAQAVNARLPSLSFAAAEFSVELAQTADGAPVAFMFKPHPGSRPLELARFASGGELSRFMLALALETGVESETQLFDEVDAGIGGRSAKDIALALYDLASSRQVLVVTHLPQVAALGERHLRISKFVKERSADTEVSVCDGEERVAEIARMLAGDSDSATARKHAAELLHDGRGVRAQPFD